MTDKALPKVGDRLIKRMSVGDTAFGLGKVEPSECVVTYVNAEHGWYEVQFPCGIRQGYRI